MNVPPGFLTRVSPTGEGLAHAATRQQQVFNRALAMVPSADVADVTALSEAQRGAMVAATTAQHRQSQAMQQQAAQAMAGPDAAQLCCLSHRSKIIGAMKAQGMPTPGLDALGAALQG
jgi:hypothetical protein